MVGISKRLFPLLTPTTRRAVPSVVCRTMGTWSMGARPRLIPQDLGDDERGSSAGRVARGHQRPASMRVRKITSYEGSTDWIVTSLNISCVRTTG